jgi:hypothetical protein
MKLLTGEKDRRCFCGKTEKPKRPCRKLLEHSMKVEEKCFGAGRTWVPKVVKGKISC